MLLIRNLTRCTIGLATLSFAGLAITQQVNEIDPNQAESIKEKCNRAVATRYQDKLQQAIATLFKDDLLEQNCIKLETQKIRRLSADEHYISNLSSDRTFRRSSATHLQILEPGIMDTDIEMGVQKQSNYATTNGSQKTESDASLDRVNGYTNISERN